MENNDPYLTDKYAETSARGGQEGKWNKARSIFRSSFEKGSGLDQDYCTEVEEKLPYFWLIWGRLIEEHHVRLRKDENSKMANNIFCFSILIEVGFVFCFLFFKIDKTMRKTQLGAVKKRQFLNS